jgi:hypothetical protein
VGEHLLGVQHLRGRALPHVEVRLGRGLRLVAHRGGCEVEALAPSVEQVHLDAVGAEHRAQPLRRDGRGAGRRHVEDPVDQLGGDLPRRGR